MLGQLDERCRELMAREKVAIADIARRYFADICYAGQAYHLEVPFEPDAADPFAALTTAFYAAHDRTYGYAPRSPLRLVNLRTVHSVAGATHLRDDWTPTAKPALKRKARILLPEQRSAVEAAVYDRAALKAGETFSGPAIIEQDDTTTLVTTRLALPGRCARQPDARARLEADSATDTETHVSKRIFAHVDVRIARSTRSPSRWSATSSTASPTRWSSRC